MQGKKNTIFLTGATGYIGSHTWCELLEKGYEVIGFDNLSNSFEEVIESVGKISKKKPYFIHGDVRDTKLLSKIFSENDIDAVIHFAALKSVSESNENPLMYYDVNLNGLISLIRVMEKHKLKNLVFSSSATVYGNPKKVPIKENSPLSATNPYAQTKLMSEQILRDLEKSSDNWRIAYLRYFNPAGAHKSGLIGEYPIGEPNNLMPIVSKVAAGKLNKLQIYGGDYPTKDGTGIRDYIHVMDLAEGHVSALSKLFYCNNSFTVNLGTGLGYSVLDIINTYEKVSGCSIPYEISSRREGDVAICYADIKLAIKLFDWQPKRGLEEMCFDSWNWQKRSLNGISET